ncbi:MAG: type II secretion system F family protein [Candidatus Omnitrophica bacterium]|nr:type II secretion system F family protein [Candidatus Omnitrophota bacterium]MDD5080971.1 type II secretion system F family protein [Candidatus Omnitrophota bacterium]MDD5440614.1 type II secretion system F family protein [Candidatus Omnitrophota bacterium]
MGLFNWTGINADGKKDSGTIDGENLSSVITQLKARKIQITDIKEIKTQKKVRRGKVRSKDLELFSRQLASLIQSRIQIVKSLDILANQVDNPYFSEVILSVKKNIEKGNSLAMSFAEYPKVFSPLFINMINVGEFSGNLDKMLNRLATYIEGYNALIKRVKSAMIYPIVVFGIAAVLLALIFIFVIPGFKSIFDSLGKGLPLPTQILISTSDFIRAYIIYMAIGITGLIFGALKFFSSEKGKRIFEIIRARIPIFGDLHKKMVLARFTKTLAILIKSGVTIINALEISGKTAGSYKLEEELMPTITNEVSRGKKLDIALQNSGFFPPMATNMIGVGEEGGDLGNMLDRVSDLYDKDVENATSALLSIMEPLIIVVLGTLIGGIVICLFLPIMKMSSMVG